MMTHKKEMTSAFLVMILVNVDSNEKDHCDNCICGAVAGGWGCSNFDGCCEGSPLFGPNGILC